MLPGCCMLPACCQDVACCQHVARMLHVASMLPACCMLPARCQDVMYSEGLQTRGLIFPVLVCKSMSLQVHKSTKYIN